MATTVNDRDLQLAATSPRVAGVTLATNITVPGLAGAIAGSKSVTLAATSQIFQIPKTGSISPSSITVTANIYNLVNTPTLTLSAGTMSVTPALSSGTFSFTAAQMTSDTITLRLSLTEASITYTDTMTFVKVREGIDSINVVLTNENVTLPGDSAGNVLSYATATGNIKVYQGINDVTSVCTFALASGGNPSGLTYSLNAGPSGSGGAYAVTAGFPTGVDLTSLTFNTTFGTTVIPAVFTLSKAKAGTAGANGTDGTNGSPGTNGTRGSVHLDIALGGSTAAWSDATANAGILSYTGTAPIRLDVVNEYNNSVGFTVTKFFDGTNWQTANAVVDGNLLVTGTVGANALAANSVTSGKVVAGSITTDKLLVTGQGKALNSDPTMSDITAWNIFSGVGVIAYNAGGSPAGPNVMSLTGTGSGVHMTSNLYPIQAGKTYKVSVWITSANSAGQLFIRMPTYNASGTGVDLYVTGLTPVTSAFESLSVPLAWTQYVGYITPTTGAVVAKLEIYNNWSTGSFNCYVSDFRCEEYVGADLIVDGAITAGKISVTSLSAITANLGSVNISTTGYIESGQTAYNTGTGFWLGIASGVPKFSIGNPSGASLRWDGTNLTITNANVATPTLTLPTYSASIPGGDLSAAISTTGGPFTMGTRTVSVSGGTSPYKYTWAVVNLHQATGFVTLSFAGANTATYTLAGQCTANSEVTGTVVCTVTDSQGRTTTASFDFDVTFGPI